MGETIAWTNEKRKLSALIPWPRNPRQIKVDQVKRLQDSLTEFGQVEPVCIGPSNELYNGHQRLKSWAQRFGDIEIEVRVSSRALTEKEREKLTVYLHKGAAGEWDFDTLSEWDLPDLVEWGFKPYELGVVDEPIKPEDEWEGMPEFEQEDETAFKDLTVHFANVVDMEEFAQLIGQTVTEKTRSIWYPKSELRKVPGGIFKDES